MPQSKDYLENVAPNHVPFAKTGPRRTMIVGGWNTTAGQYNYMTLQSCGGYLHALHLRTAGSFKGVRLVECNGSPIIDCSPRALGLISGNERTIPIAINETGLGALPDLSASCAYRLDLIEATEPGYVEAEYWPLPAPQDMFGRPQAVAPPYAGTMAFINEFYPSPEPHYLTVFRTGNLIAYLALILDQPVFRATLEHDNTRAKTVRVDIPAVELVNATKLQDMIPTVVDTRIAVENIVPTIDPHSRPRFVIRDVAMGLG